MLSKLALLVFVAAVAPVVADPLPNSFGVPLAVNDGAVRAQAATCVAHRLAGKPPPPGFHHDAWGRLVGSDARSRVIAVGGIGEFNDPIRWWMTQPEVRECVVSALIASGAGEPGHGGQPGGGVDVPPSPAAPAPADAAFAVTSPAFSAGANLQPRYRCGGQSVSPPLRLDGLPRGTASLAIVLLGSAPVDAGEPWNRELIWAGWNVAPAASLFENALAEPEVLHGGKDLAKRYFGPCAPGHYTFVVVALGRGLTLPAGAKDDAIRAALSRAAVLGRASLEVEVR